MFIINYIKKGTIYKFEVVKIKEDKNLLYHDKFIKSWYDSNFKNKLNGLKISINYATCESFSFKDDIIKALNLTTEDIIFNELF